MKLVSLCLLLVLSASGATYYVAKTGNDSTGTGSSGNPWLTVDHAATNVTAGDTVLVNPGIYNNRPFITVSGNTNNRITFKANGAVTNQGTFQVNASSIIVDGFEWTGAGTLAGVGAGNAVAIGTNVNDVWVINNQFHDCPGGINSAILSLSIPALGIVGFSSSCVISNNYIHDWGAFNTGVILVAGGTNWLISNNVISNDFGADVFRIWGGNHVVRGNVIKQHGSGIARIGGSGNAAFDGGYYWNKFYWTNWAISCPVFTNAAGYLLVDGTDSYASHGFSNKWSIVKSDRSVTYAAAPNPQGTWTMLDATIVSAPTDGTACNDHPDFIQSWGSYEVGGTGSVYYVLGLCTNLLVENNWVEGNELGTLGQINSSSGTNMPRQIHDLTFRNNVFIGCSLASVDVYNIKYHNNTFYDCGKSQADPYSGAACVSLGWFDPTGNNPRGECTGCEITNNAFIACGLGHTDTGWYAGAEATSYGINLVAEFYSKCDYNYVVNDTNAWAGKDVSPGWGSNAFKFFEPHGINGGDPKIYKIPKDFHVLATSPLVNVGASIETNDFEWAARPQGSAVDIGAYEYDPNMLMRLDFASGTTTNVPDATGNSHHAWMMDNTNWIFFTNSPKPAGVWYSNGIMTNDPGHTYNKSQYAAITNISVLSNIVNGTIAFWVYYNTNYIGAQPTPERGDTIMDAGAMANSAVGVGDPAHSTNSWVVEYAWPDLGTTPAGLIFRRWPTNSIDDTNTTLAYFTDQSRLQNNWWHVAVTWEANAGFQAYQNGVLWSTNTFAHPYLEVGGALPGWICVGAMQHCGTPAWGDDPYPNSGWLKGELSDVRIYNRALAPSEIAGLAQTGGGGGSGSSPTPSPVSGFHALQLNVGRVLKP